MSETIERDAVLATARAVAEGGLLTDREAQAHVLVNVHGWGVDRSADAMGLSESRVYDARQAAERRLAAAERTQELLAEVETGDADLQPSTCSECGDGLAEWTVAEGFVVCLSCADIDHGR